MPKSIEETLPTTEKMLTINVDPQETDGGVRINGTVYIGEHTLPEGIARQILDIIRQYKETKTLLHTPNSKIQEKNILNIERSYLDENIGRNPKSETERELGHLDPWQWQWVPEVEKERLRDLKFRMFGYKPKL